jgi:uncharacterized membrane protein YjfL (UPF0719 family)
MTSEMLMAEGVKILFSIVWAAVAAVSMGISLGFLIKFFDAMTPVNEWNQIRNGNLAMGLILGAVIVAFGFVVATVMLPDTVNLNIQLQLDGTEKFLDAIKFKP